MYSINSNLDLTIRRMYAARAQRQDPYFDAVSHPTSMANVSAHGQQQESISGNAEYWNGTTNVTESYQRDGNTLTLAVVAPMVEPNPRIRQGAFNDNCTKIWEASRFTLQEKVEMLQERFDNIVPDAKNDALRIVSDLSNDFSASRTYEDPTPCKADFTPYTPDADAGVDYTNAERAQIRFLKVTVTIDPRQLTSLLVETSHFPTVESVDVYIRLPLDGSRLSTALPYTKPQLETEAGIIPAIMGLPQSHRHFYKVGSHSTLPSTDGWNSWFENLKAKVVFNCMQQLIKSRYLTDVARQETIVMRLHNCTQMYEDRNGVNFLSVDDYYTKFRQILKDVSINSAQAMVETPELHRTFADGLTDLIRADTEMTRLLTTYQTGSSNYDQRLMRLREIYRTAKSIEQSHAIVYAIADDAAADRDSLSNNQSHKVAEGSAFFATNGSALPILNGNGTFSPRKRARNAHDTAVPADK